MPYPMPPSMLGIFLGDRHVDVKIDVFVDPCCPYSRKIFKRIHDDVMPTIESTKKGIICFCFNLTPQPWHPQSAMMCESVLAVKKAKPEATIPYLNKLFEESTNFYDIYTYEKSRLQIYEELSLLASDFVGKEQVMNLLARKVFDDGSINGGNEVTQELKWCTKYHRACGVHATPTVFINNIEAPHISSGFSLEEWIQTLEPFLNN